MSTITLVTGGSRGLGRNTAIHLAETGNDVIVTYRKQEAEARKGSRRSSGNGAESNIAATRRCGCKDFRGIRGATQGDAARDLES